MGLSVTAHFELGFYQGRDATGQPEAFPTPLRLYSSVVDAAASLLGEEPAGISDADLISVVRWFEGRPPDGLYLPDHRQSDRSARAWKNLGVFDKRSGHKKTSQLASRISALSGDIVFWWQEDLPVALWPALGTILAEIPYLGERVSAATLWPHRGSTPPVLTHRKVEAAFPSTLRTWALDYPAPGRFQALASVYAAQHMSKSPSVSQDKPSTNEDEILPDNISEGIDIAVYERPHADVKAPWDQGFLVTVRPDDGPDAHHADAWLPSDEERVAWAVALHRALVKRIGWGAPPLVTGKYVTAVERKPANHLSIQIVDPHWPANHGIATDGSASFLVLIPQGADPRDIATVEQALRSTASIFSGALGKVRITGIHPIDPATFWRPVPAGMKRWWTPSPALVLETRSQRAENQPWTLGDAVVLAVAFAWRDQLGLVDLPQRHSERYRALIKQARDCGVRPGPFQRYSTTAISRYVHKPVEGLVITAARGLLDLGSLAGPQSVAAIGQTRHLGGGLLIPVDLPIGILGNSSGESHE